MLGTTRDELGGSEFYKLLGGVGNNPPKVNIEENLQLYRALSRATEEGVVASAHDMSDGGLAVAFAECALGFGIGADLDLNLISAETDKEAALLFSESAGRFVVSVKPENAEKFEYILGGTVFRRAGRVRGDKRFIIREGENVLVNKPVEDIRKAYDKGV